METREIALTAEQNPMGHPVELVNGQPMLKTPRGYAPPFDKRINIDQRQGSTFQARVPQMQEIDILEFKLYSRNGSPRVAFNFGAVHVGLGQLQADGIFDPNVLRGKKLFVDFFQKGDILVNGDVVTDDGRVVWRIASDPAATAEASQRVQEKLQLDHLNTFRSMLGTRIGANNRGQGNGLLNNTQNGVVSANSIPAMANVQSTPASNVGSSSQPNLTPEVINDNGGAGNSNVAGAESQTPA